jgi:hypothetical protein
MIFTGFLLGVSFGLLLSLLLDEMAAVVKRLVQKEVTLALANEPPMPDMKKTKVVA